MSLVDIVIDALNFNYQVDRPNVPWRPVRVFDDGTRAYIQMPEAMRATEAPALLVQTPRGGDTALVNCACSTAAVWKSSRSHCA